MGLSWRKRENALKEPHSWPAQLFSYKDPESFLWRNDRRRKAAAAASRADNAVDGEELVKCYHNKKYLEGGERNFSRFQQFSRRFWRKENSLNVKTVNVESQSNQLWNENTSFSMSVLKLNIRKKCVMSLKKSKMTFSNFILCLKRCSVLMRMCFAKPVNNYNYFSPEMENLHFSFVFSFENGKFTFFIRVFLREWKIYIWNLFFSFKCLEKWIFVRYWRRPLHSH